MIFDECVEYPATYDKAKKAMERSIDWAQRSKNAFKKRDGHGIFGIIQGSTFKDLREISAQKLIEIDFDGYAIGGLAVGEGQKEMFEVSRTNSEKKVIFYHSNCASPNTYSYLE